MKNHESPGSQKYSPIMPDEKSGQEAAVIAAGHSPSLSQSWTP